MNEDYREALISLLKRLVFVIPLYAFGIANVAAAQSRGDKFGAGIMTVFAVICFIAGACIVAGPISQILAEFSGRIFYSGKRLEKPSDTVLKAARIQANRKFYDNAETIYMGTISAYPRDVRAYEGLIEVYLEGLSDRQKALQIYERGLKHLSKQDKEDLFLMLK